MNQLKIVAIFISVIFASSACKGDSLFIETKCEITKRDILWIKFASNQAKRTVTINPKGNLMTFMGTTYKDMKWATELDKARAFIINGENALMVDFKDGKKFQFGKISNECKKLAQNHLGALFQSE